MTISVKLDVTKIDKARLFKGEKGTYLDAVILYDSEADQYGNNGMIIQSVTKEEREAGTRGAILGNVKSIGVASPQPVKAVTSAPAANVNDDIPF